MLRKTNTFKLMIEIIIIKSKFISLLNMSDIFMDYDFWNLRSYTFYTFISRSVLIHVKILVEDLKNC